MSDESVLVSGSVAEQGVAAAVSAGTLLRQAREATGLHVAALAVAMKVPVKKLEALEADRLDDLPDAVFVRALAAAVCRTLKIDSAPILSRLPQSTVPKLDTRERALNTPVSSPRVLVMPSITAIATKPSVLLVVGILVAVLAVLFVPEARNSLSTSSTATPPAAEPVMPPADTVAPPTTSTEVAAQAAPQAPAAVPVAVPVAPTTPAAAPAAVTATAPVAAASAAVAPVAGTVVPANAPTPSGLLVFKASAASWVRVSDSNGSVVFEKTLQAGESAAANGSGTLSVVVGNVAGTEVLLRGKPYQMVDLNQNNVARFEVK